MNLTTEHANGLAIVRVGETRLMYPLLADFSSTVSGLLAAGECDDDDNDDQDRGDKRERRAQRPQPLLLRPARGMPALAAPQSIVMRSGDDPVSQAG